MTFYSFIWRIGDLEGGMGRVGGLGEGLGG